MKKASTLVVALSLVAVCFCHAQTEEPADILVSPDTVVIEEGDTEVILTVHAETPCGVDKEDVFLIGLGADIGAASAGCDSRGDLVAKFEVPTDLLLNEGDSVELTLTVDGVTTGPDEISIIDKTDDEPGGPDDKEQNREGNREGAKS